MSQATKSAPLQKFTARYGEVTFDLYANHNYTQVGTSISAAARILGIGKETVRRVVAAQSQEGTVTPDTSIPTSEGIRTVSLVTPDVLFRLAVKHNETLALAMGEAGAKLFMLGSAGLQVAIAESNEDTLLFQQELAEVRRLLEGAAALHAYTPQAEEYARMMRCASESLSQANREGRTMRAVQLLARAGYDTNPSNLGKIAHPLLVAFMELTGAEPDLVRNPTGTGWIRIYPEMFWGVAELIIRKLC